MIYGNILDHTLYMRIYSSTMSSDQWLFTSGTNNLPY